MDRQTGEPHGPSSASEWHYRNLQRFYFDPYGVRPHGFGPGWFPLGGGDTISLIELKGDMTPLGSLDLSTFPNAECYFLDWNEDEHKFKRRTKEDETYETGTVFDMTNSVCAYGADSYTTLLEDGQGAVWLAATGLPSGFSPGALRLVQGQVASVLMIGQTTAEVASSDSTYTVSSLQACDSGQLPPAALSEGWTVHNVYGWQASEAGVWHDIVRRPGGLGFLQGPCST